MYSAIAWFILRAILLFALLFWVWSFIVHSYTGVISPLANKELQLMGVADITWLGPSHDPNSDIAVYHRDAAGDLDSLFDFKLESIRSHFPMLLALVLAMPVSLKRKIKASIFGTAMIVVVDSLVCVVILVWSYTFLPDHHVFTPFLASPLRDSLINFSYNFYNAIGVGVIPLIVWALVGVRREDFRAYASPVRKGNSYTSK